MIHKFNTHAELLHHFALALLEGLYKEPQHEDPRPVKKKKQRDERATPNKNPAPLSTWYVPYVRDERATPHEKGAP